jgi:hypothetical protein
VLIKEIFPLTSAVMRIRDKLARGKTNSVSLTERGGTDEHFLELFDCDILEYLGKFGEHLALGVYDFDCLLESC